MVRFFVPAILIVEQVDVLKDADATYLRNTWIERCNTYYYQKFQFTRSSTGLNSGNPFIRKTYLKSKAHH
jgi:hypothetical protein